MSENINSSATEKHKSHKATASLILGTLALLIALGAFFLTVQNWLTQNKLSIWSNTLPHIIAQQVSDDMQAPMASLKKQLAEQAKVTAMILVQQKEDATPSALAKSKLFIAFARLSLLAGNEPIQVVPLLKAAKQALIGTPYNKAIQQIDSDMKRLQPGRGDALQTILQRIDHMQRQLPSLVGTLALPDASTNTVKKIGWFKRFGGHLKGLFIVRSDQRSAPFLDHAQALLLKMHLSIQFDLLAWAAIHNQASIYKVALSKIKKILTQGFQKNAALKQLKTSVAALDKPLVFFDRTQLKILSSDQGAQK